MSFLSFLSEEESFSFLSRVLEEGWEAREVASADSVGEAAAVRRLSAKRDWSEEVFVGGSTRGG